MKKIVYFDEESVTDYLQISIGGQLNKTTELLRETSKYAGIDGNAGVGVDTKNNTLSSFLGALIGFGGNAELSATAGAGIKANNIAQSIIQNTILTDFLESVNSKDSTIDKFENYILEVEKDSLTYIVMISPFMSMISGNPALDDTGEYDLKLEKIDETIRNAKGYYEFIGKDINDENKKVVFRFNIDAFKNNYKITDLRKMNLVIHAIHVGSAEMTDLTFTGEFDLKQKKTKNPVFVELDPSKEEPQESTFKVFDVLIAGVE